MRKFAVVTAGIMLASLATGGVAQALSSGNVVPDGSLRFLAHVTAGHDKGCSGALIDPQWVITSTSCLPETGPVTIAVGDVNVATGAGHVTTAAKVVRHTTRGVAVLKLQAATSGITPLALGSSALANGAAVKIAGFGRTATEWVPARPRTAAFTVTGTTATTAALSGDADACKGDAGAPVTRDAGGTPELVAVTASSWQHGCLDVTETRNGTTGTRTDDLGEWIRKQIVPTPTTCAAAPIWSARANGDLWRYEHHDAASGGLSWTASNGAVGSGWTGRTLAGTDGAVWDLHRRFDASDAVADGALKRWVWTGTGWTGGAVVGSGWERYLLPENKNRVTIDQQGRIWVINGEGVLRYYVWNTAANDWVNGGGTTVESGWERFDSITAAGDGVLYARKPGGELFRFQYDVPGGKWVQKDKPAGVGWEHFSEIFSPGGDILYGRGAWGRDPWSGGSSPILRWYHHFDNTDSWAPGDVDGSGKIVGSGWNTELHVTAQPNACVLAP
jgi:tachylectin/trypsin